jgi:hypothetical protein
VPRVPLEKKSIGQLKDLLDYNPSTGVVSWKVKRGKVKPGMEAGAPDAHGYRQINVGGRVLKTHRVAWALHYGEWPAGNMDHINHDRQDNRLSNLRVVTTQENNKNRSAMGDNTSGHMGVGFHKQTGKWRAYIGVDGRQIYLGLFDSLDLAVVERKRAEKKYGFHSNHGSAA